MCPRPVSTSLHLSASRAAQIFMRQISEEEAAAEVLWLAGMLKLWLDEEWSLQVGARR